jgi:hypothetical protein
MKNKQRLYFALAKPLSYLGLTVDEWLILITGVVPGIIFAHNDSAKVSIMFLVTGIFACFMFKKYKKIAPHFLWKSFLLSKNLWPRPSKNFQRFLNKRVGK